MNYKIYVHILVLNIYIYIHMIYIINLPKNIGKKKNYKSKY